MKNILDDTREDKLTIKSKLILFLFTVTDGKTGLRRIRDSEFARKIVTTHFERNFEKKKRNAYKFDLDNFIEYFNAFAEKYREEKKPFVINISKGQKIDLQIIQSSLMVHPDGKDADDFGFMIHLPFDTTNKDALSRMKSFKTKEYFDKFMYSSSEGIDDYILDCREDYELLERSIRRILVDLNEYKENDEILIDHFFA